MKRILLILLFLPVTSTFAQSIVPNGSFELSDSCPRNINLHTSRYSLGCVSWGQATWGTADYYNACDTAAVSIGLTKPNVGVPSNINGYQAAYDGDAYAGIYMYGAGLTTYKEYLIVDIPALIIDSPYEVTIHVSLADSCEYATDGIGVFFTTYGSPNPNTVGTLVETPQIDYTSYGVISDTAHWTTLTGTFIADSAYTTLIVGGFKPSSSMTIVDYNSAHGIGYIGAYYYIDGVSVRNPHFEPLGASQIKTDVETNIYPNPATSVLTIAAPYSISTVSIISLVGQLISVRQYYSDRVQIDVADLPAGIYFVRINSTEVRKFVKQ